MRIYEKFNFPGSLDGSKTLLTGIRHISEKEYVITGFYKYPNDAFQPASFVYKGKLNGVGKWYILNYPSIGQNIVSQTNLYGPCVKHHDSYNIVGNYTLEGQTSTIGCLYQGKLDGSGKWTSIIPTSLSSDPILNTICHSTYGDLVVGNYDTVLVQGKAFIYDIKSKTFTDITKNDIKSITAYGIWQNSDKTYTICGGLVQDKEFGYVVDWDNKKKKFSNWTLYSYGNNVKSIVTHFDGISATCDEHGYTLTGDYVELGNEKPKGFFAKVKRSKHCKFSRNAKWETLNISGADGISGNSVSDDIVIGVFNYNSETTVNGYVSFNN